MQQQTHLTSKKIPRQSKNYANRSCFARLKKNFILKCLTTTGVPEIRIYEIKLKITNTKLLFKFNGKQKPKTKIRRLVSFVTATNFKTLKKGKKWGVFRIRCFEVRGPSFRGTEFSSMNEI